MFHPFFYATFFHLWWFLDQLHLRWCPKRHNSWSLRKLAPCPLAFCRTRTTIGSSAVSLPTWINGWIWIDRRDNFDHFFLPVSSKGIPFIIYLRRLWCEGNRRPTACCRETRVPQGVETAHQARAIPEAPNLVPTLLLQLNKLELHLYCTYSNVVFAGVQSPPNSE